MIGYALYFAYGCFGLALLFCLFRVVFAPGLADRVLALDTMTVNMIALLTLFVVPVIYGALARFTKSPEWTARKIEEWEAQETPSEADRTAPAE